mgnify:CR=1 FL=1
MKLVILLAGLLSAQAFAAFDVCQFEDTVAFQEAVDAKKIKKTKEVNFETGFSAIEKQMIKTTINSDSSHAHLNLDEAVKEFGDYFGGRTEPGTNAGEIVYYSVGSDKFALVHYWPGDNEVGAFVKVTDQTVTLLATVSDQWIECSSR